LEKDRKDEKKRISKIKSEEEARKSDRNLFRVDELEFWVGRKVSQRGRRLFADFDVGHLEQKEERL